MTMNLNGEERQPYPTRTMRNIGTALMFIKQRGEEDRPELALWDYVRKCDKGICPVAEICPAESVICAPEKEYLQHAVRLAFDYEKKKLLDQFGLHVFGTAILPLYQQLFTFKLVAMGLTNSTTVGKGGKLEMHPVYKEIRAVMVSISNMWKAAGIMRAQVKDPNVYVAKGVKARAVNEYYDLIQDAEVDAENINKHAPEDYKWSVPDGFMEEKEKYTEDGRPVIDKRLSVPTPKGLAKEKRAKEAPLPKNVTEIIAAARNINELEDEAFIRMEQEVNEAVHQHRTFKGASKLGHVKTSPWTGEEKLASAKEGKEDAR